MSSKVSKNEVPYIFISSHKSFFDTLVTAPFLPFPHLTIGKYEFSKIPFFAPIYKIGTILVDRKDRNSRIKSYKDLLLSIENGVSVCLYPEGTRNKTKEPLLPFKDGAFKLAFQTKKSVVPVVLKGTECILPANRVCFLLPYRCDMYILDPVSPIDFMDDNELKLYCFTIMLERFKS